MIKEEIYNDENKENNKARKIHHVNKMVQKAKLSKQYKDSHEVVGTIFTAGAYNIGFTWMYLHALFPGKSGVSLWEDIYEMVPDLKELKSIQLIYIYLVNKYDSYLTFDMVKKFIPKYSNDITAKSDRELEEVDKNKEN